MTPCHILCHGTMIDMVNVSEYKFKKNYKL
jgi:hypothetical protein